MTGARVLRILLMLLASTHGAHAEDRLDWTEASVFSVAEVDGPGGEFRTLVLSDPDGLILIQADGAALRLVIGFDSAGTWQLDLDSLAVRPIDDRWRVFMIGHDLHRLWLAPETRWQGHGDDFVDGLDRPATFTRAASGEVEGLAMLDDQGAAIDITFEGAASGEWFRGAVFDTADGRFTYRYVAARPVAASLPAIPAVADRPTADLLRRHRLQRMGHLAEIPRLLAPASTGLLEIRDGARHEFDQAALEERFERYFAAVEFVDWHDREPPRLRLSPDGRQAWKAVSVRVVLAGPDDSTSVSDFAWLEAWEHGDQAWGLTAIASTRR